MSEAAEKGVIDVEEERGLEIKDRVREIVPREALGEMPQIRMLGQGFLELENHKGILAYALQETVIALRRGRLAVRGEGLTISRIDRDVICLEGVIRQVEFLPE